MMITCANAEFWDTSININLPETVILCIQSELWNYPESTLKEFHSSKSHNNNSQFLLAKAVLWDTSKYIGLKDDYDR